LALPRCLERFVASNGWVDSCLGSCEPRTRSQYSIRSL
jgi:hypothetical protein